MKQINHARNIGHWPLLQRLRSLALPAGQIYSVNDARYFDCELSNVLCTLLDVPSPVRFPCLREAGLHVAHVPSLTAVLLYLHLLTCARQRDAAMCKVMGSLHGSVPLFLKPFCYLQGLRA